MHREIVVEIQKKLQARFFATDSFIHSVIDACALLYTHAEDGDKYELVSRGLTVNRLEVYDNGTYECRAEVASHGNVKLRRVHLEVLCKDFTSSSALTLSFVLLLGPGSVNRRYYGKVTCSMSMP